MAELTAERLRALVSYDPETGIFRWSDVRRAGVQAGAIAGNKNGRGYWIMSIDKKRYMAHRVAWLYVHGRWPTDQIDHIDGNHANNAIANLREADNGQNNRNRGLQRNNKSGYKGVYWNKKERAWVAQIGFERRMIHLGFFHCPRLAGDAYAAAAQKLHGEFAKF